MPKAHVEVIMTMSWEEASRLRNLLFTTAEPAADMFPVLDLAMREAEGD